ncbi:hypothetical protein [Pseudomaricurvus alcaniphilus]|uniref:hypothetical protein n=1 Tax=Pseudomaricurvus alcaniphilus TaxID=1166482 RepID=UPI001409FB68|nr:hypothetical protein [Pseudomaricurvus alcaniphilus]
MSAVVSPVTGKAIHSAGRRALQPAQQPGWLSWLAVFGLLLVCGSARADLLCFSLAENYYEQVYCELQALGKSQGLPAWRDFRNNDEVTQALLLQRPARRAGIIIQPPRSGARAPAERAPTVAAGQRPSSPQQASQQDSQLGSQQDSQQFRQQPPQAPLPTAPPNPAAGSDTSAELGNRIDAGLDHGLHGCSWQAAHIVCAGEVFRFAANRRNDALAAAALSEANSMDLPAFSGNIEDASEVQRYLEAAFVRYVHKMIEIGLAESTLSFAKFQYIFYDISARGVSFSRRFDTMYKYLKRDKARLQVAISQGPGASLKLAACQRRGATLVSCVVANKHYVFVTSTMSL